MTATEPQGPPPAAQVDPVTMTAIAQVGIQLYSMSRSGGGAGAMMAAQTRMLAEISAELGIVNQHLIKIYDAILELRGMVAALPREIALKIVRLRLLGEQLQVGQLLGRIAEEQRQLGRDRALRNAASDVSRLIGEIRTDAAQLQIDDSVALCPALAAAWYAELQLWSNEVTPSIARLRRLAMGYQDTFRGWMERQIQPRLASLAREAESVRMRAAEADDFGPRTHCYDAPSSSTREWTSGGGGVNGDKYTHYRFTLSAKEVTVQSGPLPIQERLDALRAELEHLQAVGIEVHPAYGTMRPKLWSVSVADYYHEWEDKGARNTTATDFNAAACRIPHADVEAMVARENERWMVVNGRPSPLETLFASTVMFGHFQTITGDALASVTAVLERLPPA